MKTKEVIAFLYSQSICALAEIEGMKAANDERKHRGESMAYPEEAFLKVPKDFNITESQINHKRPCVIVDFEYAHKVSGKDAKLADLFMKWVGSMPRPLRRNNIK